MSETQKASSTMDSKLARRSNRKINSHESDEERENYNEACEYYSGKQVKNKHFGENRDEGLSRRRLTSVSVHSVTESDVKKGFRIACLICQRKIVCPNSRSSSFLAYYICDECIENEKEHTRILEAALKENKEKLRSVSVGCASISPSRCDCKNCVRRLEAYFNIVRVMEKERLREVELLRSYWNDLKKNIRLMFRNGLTTDMCSLKGKKYDVERLRRHVEVLVLFTVLVFNLDEDVFTGFQKILHLCSGPLTEKDAPQLYRRLESIGYEHVMNLKSDDLWQILVAPQVVPALIKVRNLFGFIDNVELYEFISGKRHLSESGANNEEMELERAKLFIASLLKSFMRHQETVQNMSSLLAPLDEKYFKQFGISWKVVNHRIFDRVIYQDELLINYLPKMEKVLNIGTAYRCDLIVPEESNEESINRAKAEAARTDIPPVALELARRFRFLHKLMMTSREIFKKVDASLVLLVEQQDILHQGEGKLTLSVFSEKLSRQAKQELFEESIGFYEAQRKMRRNSASYKKNFYKWHPDFCFSGAIEGPFFDEIDNSDSDSDGANLTRRIYELIEEGPPASVCVGDFIAMKNTVFNFIVKPFRLSRALKLAASCLRPMWSSEGEPLMQKDVPGFYARQAVECMEFFTCILANHNGEVVPCIKCRECSIRHCSCEDCRITHILTCGILEQDPDLSRNYIWVSGFSLVLIFGFNIARKRLSESSITDELSTSGKGRKRRASSEKFEYFEAQEASQAQAAKALISFHDTYDRRDTAWGDWQVPYHYYRNFEGIGGCLNEKSRTGCSGPHGKRS
ncbi:unnamed protein product [Enterobius vermicularis]|uniref:Uncharacterized protein n=1 Tax=Enterobius vermicularis TaxID=51028 RepID=A0A0N4V8P7_ENTVE|nr:unnamed protein product [Enterobius vermicularis]